MSIYQLPGKKLYYPVAALCLACSLPHKHMSHESFRGDALHMFDVCYYIHTRSFKHKVILCSLSPKEKLVVLSRPVWTVGTFRRRIGNFHFLCSILFPPSFESNQPHTSSHNYVKLMCTSTTMKEQNSNYFSFNKFCDVNHSLFITQQNSII